MNSRPLFALDANVFITDWYCLYPPDLLLFDEVWKFLSSHKDKLLIPEPIFSEIDPYSREDKKLEKHKRKEKYSLRSWLEVHNFKPHPITPEIKEIELRLQKKI